MIQVSFSFLVIIILIGVIIGLITGVSISRPRL